MYYKKLPVFKPVTQDELRRIWAENKDPDIRRMALEIARYRGLMVEVEQFYEGFNRSWSALGGGHLVGLHMFKQLISDERERLPVEKRAAPSQLN